ncbi:hypothetical protein [Alloprevotella tannerae]|uniref:hypothetical protein n=1 Tax=Alloprevotella tannerae TaxID=76122 RepID=UPI0028E9678D|nr:hypothetical protein [Alloprevotella tannerae]
MKGIGNKTSQSTYEELSTKGYEAEQALKNRKTVSTSEKGQKYILHTKGEASVVYSVDGNIIKEGKKCDKLILVRHTNAPEEWTEIFVELKGKDTNTAIDQLKNTISNKLFRHPSNINIWARIIGKSFPSHKANPNLEKAKISFKKDFNCDLRGLKSNQAENLIKK